MSTVAVTGSEGFIASHRFWLDISRPDDYDRANLKFEQLKPLLLSQL